MNCRDDNLSLLAFDNLSAALSQVLIVDRDLENTKISGCLPLNHPLSSCTVPSTVCIASGSLTTCTGATKNDACCSLPASPTPFPTPTPSPSPSPLPSPSPSNDDEGTLNDVDQR